MARVLGESARYVSQQTVKKRWQMTKIGAVVIAVVCAVPGFFAGYIFQNKNVPLPTLISLFGVDARWGTTGSVHCLRDDQLFDYIAEAKTGRKLSKQEIDSIAQAFLALARMDKEFKPA